MPSIRLTQRRVDALRPRRKVRDVRDAELKGYGVRVMPSGARRYFIHSQHRGKRVAGRRTPWLWLDYFWRGVREEAGLQDVRLHDARHSYASMALLCGESVRTVGCLLGHEKAATTLKYAHLSDATVREAVETLSPVLSGRQA